MIYHQIRIAMKPDVPADEVEHALDLLRQMGRELDAVEFFLVGRDIGGEFDYGAMYALKDVDAYRAYMYAPLHRRIDAVGLPLVANMISQDLTDDPDPEIGAKIAQVHADRFADHPELLELVEDLGSYQGSGVPAKGESA
ncbi:Dabb family protein [Actinomadura decatromicini]|uniref:Dabb family protein n=1 Tax=Actinomadura decatromicini TaxID=2604572 RepID=A0A5D3FP26_9ACTN|nr:Dabb family protein [Actinomadura decatromicini]TYK50557.1 Dabb family protein [Actinomadura decatromicini]